MPVPVAVPSARDSVNETSSVLRLLKDTVNSAKPSTSSVIAGFETDSVGVSSSVMVVVTESDPPTGVIVVNPPPVAESMVTSKDSAVSNNESFVVSSVNVPVVEPLKMVVWARPVKSVPSMAVPV